MSYIVSTLAIATVILSAGCSRDAPTQSPADAAAMGHVVKCDEPLPEFTLGPTSRPSKAQEDALSECIWGKLGSWERRTAEQITSGKHSEASSVNLAAFPSRFGSALEECGGMKL
jgi:hypothetical protein